MATIAPKLVNTSQDGQFLQHTINSSALSQSRATSKASRLAQAKGFSNTKIVTVNKTGEKAPPGFTEYEVIVTSTR